MTNDYPFVSFHFSVTFLPPSSSFNIVDPVIADLYANVIKQGKFSRINSQWQSVEGLKVTMTPRVWNEGGENRYQHHLPTTPEYEPCLLYTSPSPRDLSTSRMPSSA